MGGVCTCINEKHPRKWGSVLHRLTCLFTGFRSRLLLSERVTFWPNRRLTLKQPTLFLVLVVQRLKSCSINAYLSRLKHFLPVYIFFRCCKLKITWHRSLHILWVPPVSLTNSPFCPFHPDWARWGGEKKEINNRAKWERSKFNRVPDGCVRKAWTLKLEAGGEAEACTRRQARWRSNLQASIGPVCWWRDIRGGFTGLSDQPH